MTLNRYDWNLDPSISYLNHGSFGPSPRRVLEAEQRWTALLEANPMKFLVRDRELLQDQMLNDLGNFLDSPALNLIPVENATVGMNIVANTIALSEGDEVLLTDHEYGAVQRIWKKRTQETGARIVTATIPLPLQDDAQVVDAIVGAITEKTKIIVVSHITSPTALILPVEKICEAARQRKVAVVIDGPHAIGMQPLSLKKIRCDFYTASCHKWLCAPFGTGFLYVDPKWQSKINPIATSWGGTMSGRDKSWQDEFLWVGTFNPARYLAISEAIQTFEGFGWQRFRDQTHQLVVSAAQRLAEKLGTADRFLSSTDFVGSMISVPLPESVPVPETWTGVPHELQQRLVNDYKIEIPIMKWNQRMFVRLSCHLYNQAEEYERLDEAILELIREYH